MRTDDSLWPARRPAESEQLQKERMKWAEHELAGDGAQSRPPNCRFSSLLFTSIRFLVTAVAAGVVFGQKLKLEQQQHCRPDHSKIACRQLEAREFSSRESACVIATATAIGERIKFGSSRAEIVAESEPSKW